MRFGKNALCPAKYHVWFSFKTLRVREIHMMEQGVRGYSMLLCCSLASLLSSLRGVMNRGSSCSVGSSIRVRRIHQWFYCVLLVFLLCSMGVTE